MSDSRCHDHINLTEQKCACVPCLLARVAELEQEVRDERMNASCAEALTIHQAGVIAALEEALRQTEAGSRLRWALQRIAELERVLGRLKGLPCIHEASLGVAVEPEVEDRPCSDERCPGCVARRALEVEP